MKIIVTGSLGHIGRPLTTRLITMGHQVVVISSQRQREGAIAGTGARSAIGSLQDRAFLSAAFVGADAVYCMVPPDMSQPDQLAYYETTGSAYAQAIRESGVRRVVHLSSYGAHLEAGTGFIAGSHRIERMLNGIADLQLTHIRPASFYYNLLAYIPMIKAAGFIGDVYGGEDRLLMVAPADIAEAVSAELVQTDSIPPVRYVHSDERSCNEVAAILGAAIGIPDMPWKALPGKVVFEALVRHHLPEHAASMLVELGTAIHNGRLREDFDQNASLPGPTKLEDFARDFARAYHQN